MFHFRTVRMNHINALDGKHASLILIQLNAAQMHKSLELARTMSSSVEPLVKTRQAPSKLILVSARIFCGLMKSEAPSPFIMPLSTWIFLQERSIHACPGSCASNEADASDNSHPQLLLLCLRSGSQQVAASVRERLGVCSCIPAFTKLLLNAEEESSCCSPWNQLCSPGQDGTTPPETCEQQLPCKSTGTPLLCITWDSFAS